MPKSNKLLSTDHSHSHSNSLFLLIVFIHFHIILFFFLFWSKNTPRNGQKHPQVASWEPLGVLFGTSGGAFWHLWGCFLAPRGGQTHPHAHAPLFGTHFGPFGLPKSRPKRAILAPIFDPKSIPKRCPKTIPKKYQHLLKCYGFGSRKCHQKMIIFEPESMTILKQRILQKQYKT